MPFILYKNHQYMQLHIITESSQLNIMMWMIKLKMDDIYKSILTRSFKIQTILLI